jgi:hypothetical protein
MANGFTFESPLNKLLGETVPNFLNQELNRQEAIRQFNLGREDRLAKARQEQLNIEQNRKDKAANESKQDTRIDKQLKYQRERDQVSDRRYDDNLKRQIGIEELAEQRLQDSKLINIVNSKESYDEKISLASKLLEAGRVKEQSSIEELESIINSSKISKKYRLDQLDILRDSDVINEKGFNTLVNSALRNNESVYQRDYKNITDSAMVDLNQEDKIDLINLEENNKRIANAESELNEAFKLDIASNNTEASDRIKDILTQLNVQKTALIGKIKDRKSPFSATMQSKMASRVREKIASGDDFTEKELSEMTMAELAEIESQVKLQANVSSFTSETPTDLSQIMAPQGFQTTIKFTTPSVQGVPNELVGKQITPTILKKLIKTKEDFTPNPRSAMAGIFSETAPKFEFLDVLARELGFESAEALNTREGYRALQQYYSE